MWARMKTMSHFWQNGIAGEFGISLIWFGAVIQLEKKKIGARGERNAKRAFCISCGVDHRDVDHVRSRKRSAVISGA